MQTNKPSELASTLLRERSRDALRARLIEASANLEPEALLSLVADLLLTLGTNVDRLKSRVDALLAEKHRPTSERSTQAQLTLFAELLAALDGQSPQATGAEPAQGASEAENVDLAALTKKTNAEIQQRLAEEKQRKREAQAARKAAKLASTKAGKSDESWPSHLPQRHVEVPVDPADCVCPVCRQNRVKIGEETSWLIERRVVAEVVVLHRPILACTLHHGGPVVAPVPPKPVEKGHMGFELAAWAIFLRFAHNLPIARISEILGNEGLPVSEAMLHTLFSVTERRLGPVMGALQSEVRRAALINLDDTPVLVLDAEHPQKRKQGRVWLALGDEVWAWYFATPDWTAAAASKRLGKFTGVLQGDGYKGFEKLARTRGVRLAGCMAHLRRKLRLALAAKDPRATEPLALINAMYSVERLARLRELNAEEIVALRQERAVPLMNALRRWAVSVEASVEPGSPLGKAWTYFKNQKVHLSTWLTDGKVSIDNNAAERGLRRITIGRKLWLFFRSDVTVERAAVLASILTTARLQGADPLRYLEWLLRELARREWSVGAAATLLPDAWLASQKQSRQELAA